jgi:hypothetical protein
VAAAPTKPSADDPKVKEAAARVKKAASNFGSDVEAYAEKWTRSILEDDGGVSSVVTLLDECLVDDTDQCRELEEAIKSYRVLIGDWTGANAA